MKLQRQRVISMVMTGALALVGSLGLAGCNKPEESDCRRAIARIRELTGTANIQGAGGVEAAVRSCRGNATQETVRCAMEASSIEQLERCGLVGKEEMEAIKEEQAEELERQKRRERAVDAGAATPVPPPVADDDAGAEVAPGTAAEGAAPPAPLEPAPQ